MIVFLKANRNRLNTILGFLQLHRRSSTTCSIFNISIPDDPKKVQKLCWQSDELQTNPLNPLEQIFQSNLQLCFKQKWISSEGQQVSSEQSSLEEV